LPRIRRARALALPLLLGGLMIVPSLSWASSGGGAISSGTSSSSSSSGSSSTTVAPSTTGRVSASGDGISLTTNAAAVLRNQLAFTGTAPRSDAGRTIVIERLGRQTGWQWAQTVTATVASDGTFNAVWRTNHIGRFSVQAQIGQTGSAGAASAAPTLTITVFRSSLATEYGPGFYGHRTACGQRLTRTLVGVANRTLRCGTKVAILYRGQTMVVPVIDHGPYANGADWDLTMATGQALGMTGTSRIGAVSLPRQP
jgi:rare lipoprotein A